MKIGILTVYSFNYGSYFQATALYKELERLGYEVEFINEKFKKMKWGNLFLLYSFDSLLPESLKETISKLLPQYRTFLQLKKDVSLYKESSPSKLDLRKLTEKYDLVILGADEMWSASKKSIRYTKEHFGYNISCPHISYATCGSLFDMNNSKLKKKAAAGLKTFKSISVRDEYTSKFVKKLAGKDAEIVLDPTLLNPYFVRKYNDLEGIYADDGSNYKNYVLLYGQHYDESQRNYIIKKAKELDCKILSLGWPVDFADGFLNPKTAEDFQKCFALAKFCFPSTFHGTIFSILNHRPFLSMVNSLRGKKIKMLLKDLYLKDRIYSNKKTDYADIDYDKVEKVLEKKRSYSRNILLNAINKTVKNYSSIDKKCCSCSACVHVCPVNAIEMKQNSEGFYEPVTDLSKCIHCDLCKNVCPKFDSVKKQDFEQKIYGGYANNQDIRVKASSGGAFNAIASKFLADSGVVYGAAFDNEKMVSHIRVASIDELDRLSGSKYVQSNLNNCFELVINDLLDKKKVLFSGTPCQIQGLNNLVKNKVGNTDNLFTVDILCHGVPSPLIYKEYLTHMQRKFGAKITKITFRDKSKGWRKQSIKIDFENGKSYINTTDKDPFYVMYFSHVCMNNACHSCKFTSFDRVSDITLGDLWGAEKISYMISDLDKGVSLVLVNSEKGNELFENISDLTKISIDNELAYQPILKSPSIKSKARNEFWSDFYNSGFQSVLIKYGKLTYFSFCIKKIAVPIVKSLGIFDIVQKVYFGRNIRK